MADNTDDLIISISTDLATVRRSLKRLEGDVGSSTRKIEKQFDVMGRGINRSIDATASRLASTLAAAFSIRAAQQFVDASTRITNALKVAGLQGADLTNVYDKLFASAQKNAAPLESLVTLYSRLSLTQKELGVTQNELVGFTDKVALALRVGGTSAQEASGALLQLSQALGGGTVRAEEFNSVLEGAPTIVQAVAAGLTEAGGSVSKLRQLVIDGKLSSQAFFRAFEAGSVILEEKVAGSVLTTSQSLEKLQNVLIDTAGKIDTATGASTAFGKVIEDLAVTIQQFGQVVVKAADGDLGKFLGWLSEGAEKAATFKRIMGGIPGIIEKMGKLNQDLFNGKPLGTTMSDEAIQSRINDAFAGNGAAPKTGRLPALPPAKEIKTVSIADLPVAGGVDKAAKKAETAAEKAKNAYRDLLKSADDRIGSLKLESELLGEYGAATDAARFRLDLLQQSEDKGRSLSEKQRAEIEGKVELYKKYSEALAEAKLKQDMLDANRLAGMSKIDQNIIETQRGRGLPEDVNSASGKALRDQINREDIANTTASFLSEFSGGVISGGKSLGESFADAVKNAAANAMQKSLDSLFGQIGNALASALMPGGSTAASPVGAVASAASSFAAPVGAVSRSALPAAGNIGAYAKAIQAIESGGNYGALGPVTRNGDRAYGAYQVMGNNIGPWSKEALGKSISPSQFLADKGAQDSIFNHKFGGYAEKYGAGGAAQAWFGGPGSVGKGGMGADILGTTGNKYVEKFNAQIAKMGETAAGTVGGLGQLNGGLAAISQNMGAGGGLGGAGGWLSLITGAGFGGSKQLAASGGIGLFDKGGYTGPGGKMTPAGIVHKGEYVFDAATVNRIGVPTLERLKGYANGGLVGAPVAPHLNSRSGAAANNNGPSVLNVNIDGANGDPHVRELVRQGVQQALADKSDADRRGGFGAQQRRYTSQKG